MSYERGGGARGREGVCEEFFGGELNIFFRGRNAHQENYKMPEMITSHDVLGIYVGQPNQETRKGPEIHGGHKVPWKIEMLICHLATSGPLISRRRNNLSPCIFATAPFDSFHSAC